MPRFCIWIVLAALSQPVRAQHVEVTSRIERLTAAGNTTGARSLVDSLLAASAEGSEVFVEALYWHAVLDSTAAGAERDYLRLAVEYPLAPRASAALLRLAELELARQARDRARRHLAKLEVDYPQSEQFARAQYLAARLARDDGEPQKACTLLQSARTAVDANDVELRNQILYMHASCATPVAVSPPPGDTMMTPDTSVRQAPADTKSAGRFAIQLAAYNTQREAAAMAQQLQRRGVRARVEGTKAPFRVRVGRYATREDARRAMTQAGLRGIIVEADPS